MKITKSKLREIIREELLNEEEDYFDFLDTDPKKGDAIVVSHPYEGQAIYGYKNKNDLKKALQIFKKEKTRPDYLVKIVKKL